MKLIICNSLPTSRIFGEKVDAWWYQAQGMDVEFWDLAPIFIPPDRIAGYYAGAADYRYIGPNHRVFASMGELERAVCALVSESHLFWHLSRFARMHDDDQLMKLFNRHCAIYLFQHFDPHDGAIGGLEMLKILYQELRQIWYARHCRPAAVVTSGTLGRRQVRLRYPRAKVISVPSVKVLWQRSERPQPPPFAVFVDESVAFEPDTQLNGQVLCKNVPAYYRRMRDLISRVEDGLSMPVQIACSGKYHYPDPDGTFGGREVSYGKTLELLQDCSLALGHLSLALDQAIVSAKPVVLIDDFDFTPLRRRYFRDVALRFRQRPIFNSSIRDAHLRFAMGRDLSFYKEIEHRYLRERGVRGDYRQICLTAFEGLTNV